MGQGRGDDGFELVLDGTIDYIDFLARVLVHTAARPSYKQTRGIDMP